MNQLLSTLAVLLLGLAGVAAPLRAQPDELVGFRLGQGMSELKKTYGYSMRLLLRNQTDQALQRCGMESYEIERNGERLEITGVHGKIVKLDLSKSLDYIDPIAMASQFVQGYGAPRKTACKLNDAATEERTLPSECGRRETYVELNYWRGEDDPDGMVAMRIRLRAQAPNYGKAHSRITLSRGWDAWTHKVAECSHEIAQQLKSNESEGAKSDIPVGLRRRAGWWDPQVDDGWVYLYTIYYFN